MAGGSVGADDALADVGVDSIAAVELATTVRTLVGIDADVSELATVRSVAELIERVAEAAREAEERAEEDEDEGFADEEGGADSHPAGRRAREARDRTSLPRSSPTPTPNDVTPRPSRTLATIASGSSIKSLRRSPDVPGALYLGAPAFGDGPLAYVRLVRALPLGAHAVRTLERDVTSRPWPDAAAEHARRVSAEQPRGTVTLGGHSLGGVLAMESAATLEATLGRETTCFLFDAPHPVQFKSEWNDVPDDGSVRDEDSNDDASDRESTGLTYMEVALTSFHFDTVAAGWSTMSRREKYDAFETVTFQATGRRVDARAMDEEISAGPYAAQWNSGFVLDEKTGASDVSAWRILRGDFDRTAGEGTTVSGDDEETSSSPRTSSPTPSPSSPRGSFRRVRGKVVAYKAGTENSALFETELALDGGRGAVISAGGYAWALACDHLEIVHCRGTHMNLMTPESEGGDLLETIAPHLSYELARAWSDVAPVESTVAESIVESPSTLDRCDDDDALSARALARLRASGELRASAPGRRWNRHEWHPSLRLPAWTRPGTVVETFAGSNGAAGVRLPALDLAVGDVVVGLNDRAWRLAGFDDADDASRRGVRECAAYREATPLDWSNDARSTSRRPPSPTLVVVFVQDLMERVSEWSRVALAATAPVIGAHVPSRQKRQKSRRVEDEREPLEGDEADSRAAAVVLAAAARAAVTLEARASSPPSPSPALAFVALPGTTAARVALHAATQCRLRGLADTCALVVAPREAPERPPERTRRLLFDRDSSSFRSIGTPLRTRIRTRRVRSGTRVRIRIPILSPATSRCRRSRRPRRRLTRRAGNGFDAFARGRVEAEGRDRRRRRRRRRRPRLRLRPSRRRGRRPFVVVHQGRRGAGGRRRRRRRRRSTPPFATRAFARWDREFASHAPASRSTRTFTRAKGPRRSSRATS